MSKPARSPALFGVIAVLSAFSACDSSDLQFEFGRQFNLPYQKIRFNASENIAVRFDDVVDLRCPVDVMCIVPGNAELTLTMLQNTLSETFVLNTNAGHGPTERVVFDYRVVLAGLEPPTRLADPPEKTEYTASLIISRDYRPCDTNVQCGPGDWCRKKDGDCLGDGVCEHRPEACIEIYDPVCGCDNTTYGNACEAAAMGVNVKYTGECEGPCDDGTEPLCDRMTPLCSEYEILAVQNSCEICVNPATCLPWGEPQCSGDKDCPEGFRCDLCGSSSCPFCDDCVAACLP